MGLEKTVILLKPCVGLLASGWTDLISVYWQEAWTRQNSRTQMSRYRPVSITREPITDEKTARRTQRTESNTPLSWNKEMWG